MQKQVMQLKITNYELTQNVIPSKTRNLCEIALSLLPRNDIQFKIHNPTPKVLCTRKFKINYWGWTSNEGAPLDVVDYYIFLKSQNLNLKIGNRHNPRPNTLCCVPVMCPNPKFIERG